ncbi:MAG: S8 family peptidase [Anaerolineales bacterium]|nr:S8 family peptidase [Anaerolineales bacterium]MCW5854714.1 S8 family peptidase [Anaerolineales bacterium]
MADSNQHQHLNFEKLNIERPRRKIGGPGSRPRRDNRQHGKEILESINLLKQDFESQHRELPPRFDPAMIFALKLEGSIDEIELKRTSLTVLAEEPGGVVVLFSPDQLSGFQSKIESYSGEIPPNQKNPSYNWVASVTTDMHLWGAQDRMGTKLEKREIVDHLEYIVDVEIWVYGSVEEQHSRRLQLTNFVIENNGRILDNFENEFVSLSRISVHGESLKRLLGIDIVQRIELPPEPSVLVSEQIGTSIDALEILGPPPEGSPGVCIIDSGVVSSHPLLAQAIGDVRAIPARFGDGVDDNGHGTKVSGLVLCGDVSKAISAGSFEPQIFIYCVKVTNKDNRFDDERLIVNQMADAIRTLHGEYNCRVFNISLGDEEQIYMGGRPSSWAYILDVLARDLDIVIVVSSGNQTTVQGVTGPDANMIISRYPDHLLDDESRIIEPATAVNALTVGSLVNSENSYHAVANGNDPGFRVFAPLHFPSPFTRVGPGVNGSIKPDVVEEGGSFIWSRYVDGFTNDPEQEIVSTNHEFLQRLFTFDKGTSYAAAKVSHLAGLLLREYPHSSANLIRALIGASSEIPATFNRRYNLPELLRMVGYGRPDPKKALYSSDQRVTLVAEDEIGIDKLHLYEVPIPEEFSSGAGRRRISVTLAYDPPVRTTRLEYLGCFMEFNLFRGLTIDQIVDWYAERPQGFQPEQFGKAHACPMEPRVRLRSKGTLQKGYFEFSRNRALQEYQGDTLHLLIKCKSGWATEDNLATQRYALAITMEHLEEDIAIYNRVQQRLQQQVRVRATAA